MAVYPNESRRYRPFNNEKYIINLKLTKYSWWKSSGWLVYDLSRLELTVIGKYVSKQAWKLAIKQASMQVSGSNQVHRLSAQ